MSTDKQLTMIECRGIAARVWCDQDFSHVVMDTNAAETIAKLLYNVANGIPERKCVLQDWVMDLGLRHQGVLLTAVRGCDDAPKDDPSKLFTRMLRGCFLNAHCGDPNKAQTFIESPKKISMHPLEEFDKRFTAFRKNLDHYPHHYVMHVVHTMEIIGYYHPDLDIQYMAHDFYNIFCRGLHVNPETKEQLDTRLNKNEADFGRANRA